MQTVTRNHTFEWQLDLVVLILAVQFRIHFFKKITALFLPKFTSGNILSRNCVSPPLRDKKSAKSWLLLSSGCCESFCEENKKVESSGRLFSKDNLA